MPVLAIDLGTSNAHADVIDKMYAHLFAWSRRQSQRTTRSEQQLMDMRSANRGLGIFIGVYDENDTPLDLTVKIRGRSAQPDRDYLKQ